MFQAGDLATLESQYSPDAERVTRRKVSPRDPRGDVMNIPGAMLSGGRFGANPDYCELYADHLSRFGSNDRFVIVELGVLLGVGLAVWCDVFPRARVIGLDVDPELFDRRRLSERGAFKRNAPRVFAFDELSPRAAGSLRKILAHGCCADVLIDDALHDDESILTAFKALFPLLAPDGLYFIEDNATVASRLAAAHPEVRVTSRGKITLCERR